MTKAQDRLEAQRAYSKRLLIDAIRILGGRLNPEEVSMKGIRTPIDNVYRPGVKSDSQLFKEPTMAKAKPAAKSTDSKQNENTAKFLADSKSKVADGTPEANSVVTNEDGTTTTMNPTPKDVVAEQKAKALADKKAAADKRTADAAAKKLEAAEKKKVRDEQIRVNKAARAERLASITEGTNRTYTGSMLALTDRVKTGAYVKSGTGQLRTSDPLAEALDFVPVMNVIALGLEVLKLADNPYTKLNMGQQSMNLRNRMRGAIKNGTVTIEQVKGLITEHGYDTYKGHAEKVKAEKEAKAKAKVEAEAAKKLKAEADAAKAPAKTDTKEPEPAPA